jgi:hypothetical protein
VEILIFGGNLYFTSEVLRWRIKSIISRAEIFLDDKVANLVKEIIGTLELLFVRQAKTL